MAYICSVAGIQLTPGIVYQVDFRMIAENQTQGMYRMSVTPAAVNHEKNPDGTYKFNYDTFIAEISARLKETESWPPSGRSHRTELFIAWRTSVIGLIESIEQLGYGPIKCSIRSRLFRFNGVPTVSSNQNAFNFDFQTVVAELRDIVRMYGVYGPPTKIGAKTEVVSKELEVPEKVTFHWLWKNVPLPIWGVFGGVVIAAFTLGFNARAWLVAIQTPAAVTQPANQSKTVPPTQAASQPPVAAASKTK